MKLEAQTKRATPAAKSLSFKFSDTVNQYLVGLTQFYFVYGDADHHIQDISAGLVTSNTDKNVNVDVSMRLTDRSGHGLAAQSYVDVGCVAALGADSTSNLQFANGLTFNSGESATPVTLANTTFTNEGILDGFHLSYGGADHWIQHLSAKISVAVQQGKSATLSGTCSMYDRPGNKAVTKTLQASYLGTYIAGASSGIVTKEISCQVNQPEAGVNLKMSTDLKDELSGKSLTGVSIFIKSFEFTHQGGDHQFKLAHIGVDDISISGTMVIFMPWMELADDSGHLATSGSLSLVIVGTVG